jgi:hypothetical protein
VEVDPIGDERNRYECQESFDDERVSGTSRVTVTMFDPSATPTAMAGGISLENEGGIWVGEWTGVIEVDRLHVIRGVMQGFGGYEGLVFRATWEYYDWPAIATGTIEPAP